MLTVSFTANEENSVIHKKCITQMICFLLIFISRWNASQQIHVFFVLIAMHPLDVVHTFVYKIWHRLVSEFIIMQIDEFYWSCDGVVEKFAQTLDSKFSMESVWKNMFLGGRPTTYNINSNRPFHMVWWPYLNGKNSHHGNFLWQIT